MIRIALVDDHDLFREGIKLVLEQIEGFVVEFDSSNGYEFLSYLELSYPDVVLMDISMPKISGIETTRMAMQKRPGLCVVALTMFSDSLHYNQMIEAGANGFLLKKATKNELRQAIDSVVAGESYFSEEIIQKLAFHTRRFNVPAKFSKREMVVLNHVCKGMTNREIAEKLFLSIKTVETHRANIFRKAGVRNSTELIAYAIKHTIFSID